MKSQFDIISGALQDTLGENYDYRSIMHYDSTAFSRNGQNTIETMVDGFTGIIGSATDLSDLDVIKVISIFIFKKRCLLFRLENYINAVKKKKKVKLLYQKRKQQNLLLQKW